MSPLSFSAASLTDTAPAKPFAKHLLMTDEDGYVLSHRPYRVWLTDGRFIDGVTSADGLTQELETAEAKVAKVDFLKRTGAGE